MHLALSASGFNLGYSTQEVGDADETSSWYANYTHTLTTNVSIFGEVGDNDEEDANGDGTDAGYAFGMQVKF